MMSVGMFNEISCNGSFSEISCLDTKFCKQNCFHKISLNILDEGGVTLAEWIN
jgi:hypothetical protein